MNITEMQEKINYIADYYGLESQRWKAVEELIELANALTQIFRQRCHLRHHSTLWGTHGRGEEI